MFKTIRQPQPARQRGLTLFGLLLCAIIVAAVVVIGAKVVPSVSEYMACVKGVKLAANETTPDAARTAFDRYATVGYITTISGKDIDINQAVEGGPLTASFAYDKEIQIFGPVYLLIKYHGSSQAPQ